MGNYTSGEIYGAGKSLNMELSDFYIPYSEWSSDYNLAKLLDGENDFFGKKDFPKILISAINVGKN